jgi:ribonuclease D
MFDPSQIIHVNSQKALEEILSKFERSKRVALDTEADSLHHYFEKVCLIQLSVPGLDVIVDPLAEGINLSPLLEILSRKPLIIQGADYDLRMMGRDFNFKASSMFDTMLAAQLLGYEKISYAGLVERHCGIELSKHGQKADWSKRPLPEKLIEYAACDTHYLFQVAETLEAELAEAGRLHWLEESCTRLLAYVAEGGKSPDPEKQWRIKGWHKLRPGRGWAFLRELWNWRDEESRRLDFPAYKVMRNEALVEIATWAQNGFKPEEAPHMPKNIIGRRRRELEAALARVRAMSPADWPKPLESTRKHAPPVNEAMLTRLKKVRDKFAEELKIDAGNLLSGSCLAAISQADPTTLEQLQSAANLANWQVDVLGRDLLSAIADFHAASHAVLDAAGADAIEAANPE